MKANDENHHNHEPRRGPNKNNSNPFQIKTVLRKATENPHNSRKTK